MTVAEFLLLRGGWTPAELGLPDDVVETHAPRGIPARATIDTRYGFAGLTDNNDWHAQNRYNKLKAQRRADETKKRR
jgi:hypothetical protein